MFIHKMLNYLHVHQIYRLLSRQCHLLCGPSCRVSLITNLSYNLFTVKEHIKQQQCTVRNVTLTWLEELQEKKKHVEDYWAKWPGVGFFFYSLPHSTLHKRQNLVENKQEHFLVQTYRTSDPWKSNAMFYFWRHTKTGHSAWWTT